MSVDFARGFPRALPGETSAVMMLERGEAGVAQLKQMTRNVGADAVLECVGTNESMRQALDCARPGSMIGYVGVPDRFIYCVDLRDFNSHPPYVEEVRRIATECRERREARQQEASRAKPTFVELGLPQSKEPAHFAPEQLLQPANRRWYPVIDYSRCTNCMECIDFCLFGVYGVDGQERILVENQDSCKRGCPACSRVCPEHAIMFPEYKTPAIAGAPVGAVSGLKIDLTKLFGGGDAMAIAAQERDRELVADGREAVGLTVGIPKRQAEKAQAPKDDLDKLMDALDELEI